MKNLIVIFSFIFLIGCDLFNTRPDITVKTDNINTCNNPPKADAIVMRDVEPIVITDKYEVLFIGITPKQYENLSLNMQEMLKHIKQQNAVIEYYKNCYNQSKKEASK